MSALPEVKEPESKLHEEKKERSYFPPPQGQWTYTDYLRLPENDNRYEIMEGDIMMSPSPIPRHQQALRKLIRILDPFIEEHDLGTLWVSPVDVVFPGEKTILQPDLFFLAKERAEIVTETNVNGVPDLVIEIISPGSTKRDRREKYKIYMQAGVKEYWIVDPQQKTLDIHVLRGEAYVPLGKYKGNDQVHSEVLGGLTFSLRSSF